jgi:pimeloyl-ACP methyl ester carboxylesterase
MSQADRLIRRIEEATAEDLPGLLLGGDEQERQAVEAHLGKDRLDRIRRRVAAASATRSKAATAAPRGHVVLLPGLMGSALAKLAARGPGTPIWLDYLGLARGRLGLLRLQADGSTPFDRTSRIGATGVLKKYYAELMIELSVRGWVVHDFPYDWRLDLDASADALDAKINQWLDDATPFHLVAHSMGGLVARAYLKRHGERFFGGRPDAKGGRLVQIGTPNHGSFLIPQALRGASDTVRKLSWLDVRHDRDQIVGIIDTFPGVYSMLPSPRLAPAAERLYDASTYGSSAISQRHCDRARAGHDDRAALDGPDRLFYLAGYGQPTVTGISDFSRLDDPKSYTIAFTGDGSVPLALGPPRNPDGSLAPVRTAYFSSEHVELCSRDDVFDAVDEALRLGTLPGRRTATAMDRKAASATVGEDDPEARRRWNARRALERRRLTETRKRLEAEPGSLDDQSRALDLAVSGLVGPVRPSRKTSR